MAAVAIESYLQRVGEARPIEVCGRVTEVVGLTIEASAPPMRVGDLCYIQNGDALARVPVEVVGFRGNRVIMMPLADTTGVSPGALVFPTFAPPQVSVGLGHLGRIIGSMGQPLDDRGPLPSGERVPLRASPPAAMSRTRIKEPLATGIRAIDACITCGRGQRLGILSGSGVGKSKLLGMVARNTSADVNIIALIGERGREVREFVERDLGPEGLARSVVIVATSDEPALRRIQGAYLATAAAEWFRDQGADVMLMMDSVTRFAMAQREVGLAVGEPPTTRGYPPSVFAELPKLLERAGTSEHGSITGIYSVLVEADDLNDPVGDAVRSILDGHVALSRDLATRNHYPAIDVLQSVSRCMIDVTPPRHQELAGALRQVLATYRDAEDLINIGAYVEGSNPDIDHAIAIVPHINQLLRQGLEEPALFDEIETWMGRALGGGHA